MVEHVLGMVVGVTDAIQAPDRKENHDRRAFVRYNQCGLLCYHSSFGCLSFSTSMVPFQSVGPHRTPLRYVENWGSKLLSLSVTTTNPSSLSFESLRSSSVCVSPLLFVCVEMSRKAQRVSSDNRAERQFRTHARPFVNQQHVDKASEMG